MSIYIPTTLTPIAGCMRGDGKGCYGQNEAFNVGCSQYKCVDTKIQTIKTGLWPRMFPPAPVLPLQLENSPQFLFNFMRAIISDGSCQTDVTVAFFDKLMKFHRFSR